MFFVYIIVSKKDGYRYIGFTENLKRRLADHNAGKTKSIRSKVPFTLHYFEAYHSKSMALARERQLKKSSWHKKQLFDRIFGKDQGNGPFV